MFNIYPHMVCSLIEPGTVLQMRYMHSTIVGVVIIESVTYVSGEHPDHCMCCSHYRCKGQMATSQLTRYIEAMDKISPKLCDICEYYTGEKA